MILAVVGMKREARLLARIGVRAVVGGSAGGLSLRLEQMLSPPPCGEGLGVGVQAPKRADFTDLPPHPALSPQAGEGSFSAVLSFGVAGGLDPSLKAGDVVVASGVWTPKHSPDRPGGPDSPDGEVISADPAWATRLLASIVGARSGLIAGQNNPAARDVDKFQLHTTTGALAVDMESHIAAAAAARHGLPFAAIRAISDPADHTLPAAALAGFGADGGVDLLAVIRDLARDPRQLPALIRTGLRAERAFTALCRASEYVHDEHRPF